MKTVLLFVLIAVAGSGVSAQDSLAPRRLLIFPHKSRIVSSVPFQGINYCIKIAPLTARNIDNMPIVNPFENHPRLILVRSYVPSPDSLVGHLRNLERERKNRMKLR